MTWARYIAIAGIFSGFGLFWSLAHGERAMTAAYGVQLIVLILLDIRRRARIAAIKEHPLYYAVAAQDEFGSLPARVRKRIVAQMFPTNEEE